MECQEINCENEAMKIHSEDFEKEFKDENGRRYLDKVCTTETHVCEEHAIIIDKSTDSTYGKIIDITKK
jgi:hypothetical protein